MSEKTKLKSCQWVGPISQRPKKAQSLTSKILDAEFWDDKGVILLGFFIKGKYSNWLELSRLTGPTKNRNA